MTVAFLGPEAVRDTVEMILARDNIRVHNLDQALVVVPGTILLIIIARPLRNALLARLRGRFPRARLVALARRVHRAPIEMLGFADVWKLRQKVRAVAPASPPTRSAAPARG
jgi:hypothetical protein